MPAELSVVEQRYLAGREVLDTGAKITDVATPLRGRPQDDSPLARGLCHRGSRHARDRSSKPDSWPQQIAPEIEARIASLRRAHPGCRGLLGACRSR
jgi:hypothetical protein